MDGNNGKLKNYEVRKIYYKLNAKKGLQFTSLIN